jgi:hypothetical protein
MRFLLLLTAVIAVGAAFFGWRERQLEPQRRAMARIVELGGSVEKKRRGLFEAIWRGCDTEEVVSVTLPGHLTDEALPDLKALPGLRQITMSYTTVWHNLPLYVIPKQHCFIIDRDSVLPHEEEPRFARLNQAFPRLQIDVSHDGNVVSRESAFWEEWR